MLRFKHISSSSCSDDGIWATRPDSSHMVAAYRLWYWDDLDSTAKCGKYNVRCGWLDLTDVEGNVSALRSCGWEFHPVDGTEYSGTIWCPHTGDIVARPGTDAFVWCIVDARVEHGAWDVADDVSGDNRRALVRSARYAL